MKWQTALELARNQPDVTYVEWCNMYVDMQNPTVAQVEAALKVAHPILVRNNVIKQSVKLSWS